MPAGLISCENPLQAATTHDSGTVYLAWSRFLLTRDVLTNFSIRNPTFFVFFSLMW